MVIRGDVKKQIQNLNPNGFETKTEYAFILHGENQWFSGGGFDA